MSRGSSTSKGFGGPFKRFTSRAKELFGSRVQLLTAHERHIPSTPQTESRLARAGKSTEADVWLGLKAALRSLEESDSFLPLKPAVAGFLGVVNIFEAAAQNREHYAELALDLLEIVEEFKEHPGKHTSSKMSDALKTMASGLQEELEYMQEQRRHLVLGQDMEARQDVDIQECHRRVETLCRELQNEALNEMWRIAKERQLDARLEKLNAALTAMYDSEISIAIGRRKCTPGTRRLLLEGMRIWANEPKAPKVYWLTGPAGTGKTTLAYSFCAGMKAGRLGASFFCSRADVVSRDVSRIIPTIAHQLARLLPAYQEELIRQVGENKDLGERTTEAQFEVLMRDPLRKIQDSVPVGIVVVIDALDECDAPNAAQDVLNVLFRHATDLPIKFFVTCRPEPGLHDALHSKDEHHRSMFELHDIGKMSLQVAQADIRTYLKDELASTSLSLEKVGQLAEQAGSLFIYAATAVRYINPQSGEANFEQCLENLLSAPSKTKSTERWDLDCLYTAVLPSSLADEGLDFEQETIWQVLLTAVRSEKPMRVTAMAKLLGLEEQDIIYALQHLRAVLYIPHVGDHISTLHASFPDFIFSRERSGDLGYNVAQHNRRLALRCFSTMQGLLRFNICNLESSFVLDKDTPGLVNKIEDEIPPELFYACRYWAHHLLLAGSPDDVCSALEDFLSNQLLFWMEVMNLRNCIAVGAQMLSEAHRWLEKAGKTNDMAELARDADRFVTAFGMSQACRSTPHIYISALPFWPGTRPVRQRYWRHTRGLIRLNGQALERNDPSCLAIWATTSRVLCIAVSPDGTRIVSGSLDSTIRVWDARSGDLVAGPFQGHTSSIYSVGFSPDSTRIVSGSLDNTIRVWDARSGDLVAGPFQGHTSSVLSVGFSPDGTRIVSGSVDNTIRVWDARSGDLVAGPFQGHTSSVYSVGFSPDGTRIVSGSVDNTIRVWDARSGDLVARPFQGRTSSIYSVGFSPDGTRIVSGSLDNTIRVWDARSGDLVAGPFQGHTSSVLSVGFSPDGTRIVSGSVDNTIRVWDARSGDLVAGPFQGHTSSVNSVGFSPDGNRIISGSDDSTIRVWDASTSDLVESRRARDWLMDQGGMVTAPQGQLLLHIPPAHRSRLLRPPTTVYIGADDHLALDFAGVWLGRDWVKTYQS